MSIKNIVARQKEEIKQKLSARIIPREVNVDIKKQIIKVISGVRRCGKSTLGVLLLKNEKFSYVNFDEREILDYSSLDIEKALKEIYGDFKYILLDEIQNYNKWELWVNSLYRRNYNLIITGSNSRLLSKELASHLTGRYKTIELFPFNFKEVLTWLNFDLDNLEYLKEKQGKVLNILKEYLYKGGFPEIWTKDFERDYLETLFENILYKDIVKRWKIRYTTKLEDLARYLLSCVSSKYTISKLKNTLDFSSKTTVEKYIKYLEEAYLFFSLEKFSYKEKEKLKSPKKIYSVDTGFTISISFSKNLGKLIENLVFLELRRKYKENRNLFYFQSKEGYEVDFLVKEGLKIKQLIQVTYATEFDEINPREWRALLHAYELFKSHKPELIIITWDYEDERKLSWFGKEGTIKFIPLWKWLLNIKF